MFLPLPCRSAFEVLLRILEFCCFSEMFNFSPHPQAIPRFEGAGEKKVVQKLKHPRTNEIIGTAINEVKDNTMYMVQFTTTT